MLKKIRILSFVLLLAATCSFADKYDDVKKIEDRAFADGQNIDLSKIQENIKNGNFNESINKRYENIMKKVDLEKDRIFGKENKENLLENLKISEKSNLNDFVQKNRIYVFMSQSVPLGVWHTYGKFQVENKIVNSTMLLRGCIDGNCKYIKPTSTFAQSVMNYEKDKPINPNITIDPLLFRKFNIDKAPCVVYAEDVNIKDYGVSEGAKDNADAKKYYKSCGDWNMMYHLKTIQEESKSAELKAIIDDIENTQEFGNIRLQK